jgi:catechol 2,3-dioxygenase-like lactoylglutathione lyase family enzyme
MSPASFQLDHLNLPARDPDGLARWYAQTFGLQAEGHKVRGPGVLIAFQRGEPLKRAPELHLGFRVSNMQLLTEWAEKFGKLVKKGEEFNSFQTLDPEDNCLEIYCKADG